MDLWYLIGSLYSEANQLDISPHFCIFRKVRQNMESNFFNQQKQPCSFIFNILMNKMLFSNCYFM